MQKVITINLNGNAYQLDESAYHALRLYLDNAEAQLAANPDRAEILSDLEQAIADKCKRFLGPGKTVVSEGEIDQVLREIGPIDGGHGASQPGQPLRPGANGAPHAAAARGIASAAPPAAPKRLYQIREGAMFSGVCNGIAAYMNLDPTVVRVAFTLAAIVEMAVTDNPPWMVVILYVLLMFLVPYAKTSEELAAAQGAKEGLPYRVQEIVERVKEKLDHVKAKLASRHWPWEKKA